MNIYHDSYYEDEQPSIAPSFELIQQLLRRSLDDEELVLLNHIDGLSKLGIAPPYQPPPGMTEEWADAIAKDIETKLADIVHKLDGVVVPSTANINIEITPEEN